MSRPTAPCTVVKSHCVINSTASNIYCFSLVGNGVPAALWKHLMRWRLQRPTIHRRPDAFPPPDMLWLCHLTPLCPSLPLSPLCLQWPLCRSVLPGDPCPQFAQGGEKTECLSFCAGSLHAFEIISVLEKCNRCILVYTLQKRADTQCISELNISSNGSEKEMRASAPIYVCVYTCVYVEANRVKQIRLAVKNSCHKCVLPVLFLQLIFQVKVKKKKNKPSKVEQFLQACWCVPEILELGKQRQEDWRILAISPGYKVSSKPGGTPWQDWLQKAPYMNK